MKEKHHVLPVEPCTVPMPPVQSTNNPPDVILELTHEQATFMLENCMANISLCLKLVMSIADEKISNEEKQKRAEKIVKIGDQFRDVMALLRKAGAREKEE